MTKLKIGYFADGPWSHQALDQLLGDQSLEIRFICARHDNPDPVLKARAAENGLDFLTHADINAGEFQEWMAAYRCDLFVSMSFNQIFRPALMNLPPLRTINCHAGKLPFYRGRNILNWALINDEPDFGITVHYVDVGIDTGDIIVQRTYPITDEDDYGTLLTRAYEGCANCLFEAVKLVQSGDFSPLAQHTIHPVGFYCTGRKPGDEKLDWNQGAREVFNFVRAICRPGPEARTYLGDAEIRINKVECVAQAPRYKGIVGAVVGTEQGAFYVKTSDSCVKVTQWSGYPKPRIGDRLK